MKMEYNLMKLEMLHKIRMVTNILERKVELLETLDSDATSDGCYDLHDQLHTFNKLVRDLKAVTDRSIDIVPGGLCD